MKCFLTALAAAALLAGCGGSSAGDQGTQNVRTASRPVSANETGRQTLQRAREYMANNPALEALLEEGVRTCGADDLLVLAERFGSHADPLSLGTAYSQSFDGTERIQAAALGCYLGAQVRLEHDRERGENG